MSHTKEQCCVMLRGEGRYGAFNKRQCERAATVEREGKHYCKQHDPEAVKARREASNEKYRAKWDAKAKVYARRNAEEAFCSGIDTDALKPGGLAKLIEAAVRLRADLKIHRDAIGAGDCETLRFSAAALADMEKP